MPDFGVDDITIEPWEFVHACRPREIEDLINELIEEGHLTRDAIIKEKKPSSPGLHDSIFENSLNTIFLKRLNLTIEEEEYINNLAKRLQ